MAKQAKGKKRRKIDRNRKWCEAYRARGQREKNKALKLSKHLVRHPNDLTAKNSFATVRGSLRAAS